MDNPANADTVFDKPTELPTIVAAPTGFHLCRKSTTLNIGDTVQAAGLIFSDERARDNEDGTLLIPVGCFGKVLQLIPSEGYDTRWLVEFSLSDSIKQRMIIHSASVVRVW